MHVFDSYDGTALAYTVEGTGAPLVCLPGGPARDSVYLGNLGGLSAHRSLIRLDFRGVGGSSMPDDEATYRVDRLVADVEALRAHLDLDVFDLLGHSAGASVAHLYAIAYPHRLSSLTIVTGSLRVLGLPAIGVHEAAAARSGESWYPAAAAAEEALAALESDPDAHPDPAKVAELEAATAPFMYGRWDSTAQAHAAAAIHERSAAAAAGYYRGYAVNADGVRSGLAGLLAPVLVIAGELDCVPTPAASASVAALFRRATTVTIAGGGHYPWLDNPEQFAAAVESFLAGR